MCNECLGSMCNHFTPFSKNEIDVYNAKYVVPGEPKLKKGDGVCDVNIDGDIIQPGISACVSLDQQTNF